jgi:WD40 repeat protein
MPGGDGVRQKFGIGMSWQARFDASGRRLVTLGKRITLWDVDAGKRIATGPSFRYPSSVDVSPDGRLVAAKNTLGDVLVLDGESLEELARFSGKPYGEGTDVRFGPCSKKIVDGSWQGHLLVRDAGTGEVVWEELEEDEAVTPLVVTRNRQAWAYVRGTRGAAGMRDRLLLRRWPFDGGNAELVLAKPDVDTLAIDDSGELVALRAWPTLEVWRVGGAPAGAASLAHSLSSEAISGTGEQLDWHPGSRYLAHSGDNHARVFTSTLDPVWSTKTLYPCDVRFSDDGTMLAVGDWSRGAVHRWPPA